MFLRFLAVSGQCSPDLVAAVPRIADWKLSSLPRYISADDINRLVAACDPATGVGARDRAVILLLARLGLRAGDVRDLRLGDLDWSRGRFRVMGKGRYETWSTEAIFILILIFLDSRDVGGSDLAELVRGRRAAGTVADDGEDLDGNPSDECANLGLSVGEPSHSCCRAGAW